MSRYQGKTNYCEKERIRQEINAQVREFLERGGKIDIRGANERGQNAVIGPVWHSQEEYFGLGR